MLGGEFPTVMTSDTGEPVSSPSKGVTVHMTVSPPEKPLERVDPEPAVTPFTDHSKVDVSRSPSASS